MEEKKERKAVAKKHITPMMKEWAPISPKMPEPIHEEVVEDVIETEKVEEPVIAIEADNEFLELPFNGTTIIIAREYHPEDHYA